MAKFARQRRLHGFGLIILLTIAASIALCLASGNARIALVKDVIHHRGNRSGHARIAARTAPPLFYFGRKFATDGSPAGLAAWDSYWPKSATFRRSRRIMTNAWGVAFLTEAVIRLLAAYTLATSTVVAPSVVVPLIVVGLLMLWTFGYAGRTRARSHAEVLAADTAFAH